MPTKAGPPIFVDGGDEDWLARILSIVIEEVEPAEERKARVLMGE